MEQKWHKTHKNDHWRLLSRKMFENSMWILRSNLLMHKKEWWKLMILKEREKMVNRIPIKMSLWVNSYISLAFRLLPGANRRRLHWSKKTSKIHRYRSNNRLWPNRIIYVYRMGNHINLYFLLSEIYRPSIKFPIQIKLF